jgi:hypothetical protein
MEGLMRPSKTANLILAIPFLLAACGDSEEGEPMTGLLESFEGEVAELETAALAEEARHQTALAAIVTALDGVHDGLHDEAAEFMCHGGHDEA